MFDERNVIISVIIEAITLNMNMGVFRIHDRNTLYKIGDLKYNGKYFFKCGLKWPNLPLTDYFQISCNSSFKMEKKVTMFYIEST